MRGCFQSVHKFDFHQYECMVDLSLTSSKCFISYKIQKCKFRLHFLCNLIFRISEQVLFIFMSSFDLSVGYLNDRPYQLSESSKVINQCLESTLPFAVRLIVGKEFPIFDKKQESFEAKKWNSLSYKSFRNLELIT